MYYKCKYELKQNISLFYIYFILLLFHFCIFRIKTSKHQFEAAICEKLLLEAYGINLPNKDKCTTQTAHPNDKTSEEVLKMYQPYFHQKFQPKSVLGDGNCLYCAASLALYSTENHHKLLRLLTTIEIILNRSSYDKSQNECVISNRCNNVILAPYSKVIKEATTLNSYQDIMHVYALSAALKLPISSYYPQITIENLSSAYNKTIILQ